MDSFAREELNFLSASYQNIELASPVSYDGSIDGCHFRPNLFSLDLCDRIIVYICIPVLSLFYIYSNSVAFYVLLYCRERFKSHPRRRQIHGPLLGDKVDYGIGMSYRPVSQCSLTGRYDKSIP
jgi:hypothetical protein